MVFFSVPYDRGELAGISTGGWSAKVNGKAVDIRKVFYGFMAVEVPEGEDVVIEFEYNTPGRTIGILASLFGFILYAAYLLYFKKVKKESADYAFFDGDYYDDMGYPDFAEDEGNFKLLKNFFSKKASVTEPPEEDDGETDVEADNE